MKKMLTIILTAVILNGCSAFAPQTQSITVVTNVPRARIFVNGQVVDPTTLSRHGTIEVRRNQNVSIMATAEGHKPAIEHIDTKLSQLGWLDIVFFPLAIPLIGLAFPGSRSLRRNNIAIELVPLD